MSASIPCPNPTTDGIRRGPIDWGVLLGERYWHPTWGGGCWCAYHHYDLECPKCTEGMLIFQAAYDGGFGLVWADCACEFSDDEQERMGVAIDEAYRERSMSRP